MDLLVVAKAPVPGRVKTRLCPPYSYAQAAALAEAALGDTLAAAAAAGADRVLVALEGPPGEWVPPGVEIVDQGEGSLAERLAHAWTHVRGEGLQIGMDTPQLTPALLRDAMDRLHEGDVDAVLGLALDGGWWAIGMRPPDSDVFRGVPMSAVETGASQHRELIARGRNVEHLAVLRDVDTYADAAAVAAAAPHTRFARAFASLSSGAA